MTSEAVLVPADPQLVLVEGNGLGFLLVIATGYAVMPVGPAFLATAASRVGLSGSGMRRSSGRGRDGPGSARSRRRCRRR